MFRAGLTLVLSLIVALPQGICFCDLLRATEPEPAAHCPCEEAPAPPATPGDSHDDSDHDCPCKLRQVMASQPTTEFGSGQHADALIFLGLLDSAAAAILTPALTAVPPSRPSCESPVARIPCALRI